MKSRILLGISLVLLAMLGLSFTHVGFVFGQIDNSINDAGIQDTVIFQGESITGSEPSLYSDFFSSLYDRSCL